MLHLSPANDPDSMVACNNSPGEVCFLKLTLLYMFKLQWKNLVDTAGVHEEVCEDFHDRLNRTLGPDLMHDVLQHCPLDNSCNLH